MLLTGKTVVISGAASKRGIGRGTARLFAGLAPPPASWGSTVERSIKHRLSQ